MDKSAYDDYNSDEDEDYILSEDSSDEKPEAKKNDSGLSERMTGVAKKRRRKNKVVRVGAKVLSDDEDGLLPGRSKKRSKNSSSADDEKAPSSSSSSSSSSTTTSNAPTSRFESLFSDSVAPSNAVSSSEVPIPAEESLDALLARESKESDSLTAMYGIKAPAQKKSRTATDTDNFSMEDIIMSVEKSKKKKNKKRVPEEWEKLLSAPSAADIIAENLSAAATSASTPAPTSKAPIFSSELKPELASEQGQGTDITKYVVEEEVDYAGEKVMVKRVLQKGTADEAAYLRRLKKRKEGDNLAALVQSLNGPRNMSTLDKSRIDWALDKQIEGDADDLDKERKDGFLSKQAFLAETDAKLYEMKLESNRAAAKAHQNSLMK